MSKCKSNKYLGAWIESSETKIKMSFNMENLRLILQEIIEHKTLGFSHEDLANWCYQCLVKLHEENDEDHFDKHFIEILSDIDAQWELYLVNTYSLGELKQLNFSKVELPLSWLKEWLEQTY